MTEKFKNKIIEEYGSLENYKKIKSQKRIQNIIEKYGSLENYNRIVYEKRIQTIIKEYGSLENFSKISKEKEKQTIIKEYGSLENFNKLKAEKIKKHNIEKYGVENVMQNDEIREKAKNTIIEKFSTYENFQKHRVKKSKITLKEKYGNENYNNREKALNTSYKKYGKDNYNNRLKREQTCLEKYGVKTPLESKQIFNMTKETLFKKYGVDSPFKSKEIREKALKSILSRYGCHQSIYHINDYQNLENRDFWKYNFLESNKIDKQKVIDYFNIGEAKFYNTKKKVMPDFNTLSNYGIKESMFLDIISEIFNQPILRQYNIEKFRLDGFMSLGNEKVGIEFLGDYWHNFNDKNSEEYIFTFERFNNILQTGQVNSIWYIWEHDFDKFIRTQDFSLINVLHL